MFSLLTSVPLLLFSSSISPVARLTALHCLISLLLVTLLTRPSTCNRDDSEVEEQVDALSVQLSITAPVTPTPLWAVVWGPTQPLEDETYHFLSSQDTEQLYRQGNRLGVDGTTSQDWPHGLPGSMQPPGDTLLGSKNQEGVDGEGTEAEETEPEEGGQQQMQMKDF